MSTMRAITFPGMPFGDNREPTEVFEAQPVLDLLERAYWTARSVATTSLRQQLVEDLESALRAHGRLGGEA